MTPQLQSGHTALGGVKPVQPRHQAAAAASAPPLREDWKVTWVVEVATQGAFIRTAKDAHGLYPSRDGKSL